MMRPTIGVKPQERIVLYTDLPSGIPNPSDASYNLGFGVGVATSTDYFKVTWWDGSTQIVNCNTFGIQKADGTVLRGNAYKIPVDNNLKKVVVEPSDVSGNLKGNITFFSCDKRKSHITVGGADSAGYNLCTKEIDVSTCQQLKVLKCDRNKLTSLGDINACKNISTIACSGNCFASIDVSRLSNLEQFFCNHNPNLKSLTIGTNLKRLGASSCGLTGISFPSGSQLYQLFMKDSLLTGITVDNIQNLRQISLTTQTNNPVEVNPQTLTSFSGNTLPNLTKLSLGLFNYCANFITNKVSSVRLQGSMKGDLNDFIIGNKTIISSQLLSINGCSMSTSALNTMYTDLRNITSDPTYITIFVEGITGFAGSNTTTATTKGYVFGPTC